MPAAAQKVRATDESSMELKALLRRRPPMNGPIARARLAPDCIIPSMLPCSSSDESFEARLVSDGAARAFPIERTVQMPSKSASPPEFGPRKGKAKKLKAIMRQPMMASFDS